MIRHLKTILGIFATIGLMAAGLMYWHYIDNNPSTDNAYLNANRVYVNANVSGQLTKLLVQDNQLIKQGELLFTIDDAPLIMAFEQAKAQVNIAEIALANDQKTVHQAQVAIMQAKAQFDLDKKNSDRIHTLVQDGKASKAEGDKNDAQFTGSTANLSSRKDQYQQALLALQKDKAQLKYAKSQLTQASLNIQYSRVYAPTSGKIAQLTIRPGDMIRQGQSIFSIIEQTHWWVDANFKETQLKNIKPGQKATIYVDMLPNHPLEGCVESISPATGNSFSLLPAENAAGNWVKITQRIPVKIRLSPSEIPLTLGASATVTVHTKQNG